VQSSIEASFFGKNDIWAYEKSSYELARLERIAKEVHALKVQKVLEIGAHEGALTKKLLTFTNVFAFERSEVALSRGKENAPTATWILGDFENKINDISIYDPDVVLFSEVIYYFNDYKKVLKALEKGPRFVVFQNVSKIHKRIESFMLEQGWHLRLSATSNPFGLGIYESCVPGV
jgi:tRNA A58 N-methylase Trm61